MKELGVKEKWSASGLLLKSLSYGWRVFGKTLSIVLKSDLRLNLHRIFNLKRFIIFFKVKSKVNSEINSGYNNFE